MEYSPYTTLHILYTVLYTVSGSRELTPLSAQEASCKREGEREGESSGQKKIYLGPCLGLARGEGHCTGRGD